MYMCCVGVDLDGFADATPIGNFSSLGGIVMNQRSAKDRERDRENALSWLRDGKSRQTMIPDLLNWIYWSLKQKDSHWRTELMIWRTH